MKKLTLCFDFDNTIVMTEPYPVIIGLMPHAADILAKLHARGHYIIISTCRAGPHLNAAVRFLKEHGIYFDAFCENNPARVKLYNGDCRKISADIYFDDRAYPFAPVNWMNYYDFVLEQERK